MAELKSETKIARLIDRMKPLADWYTQNKPSCTVIRLPPDDLKLLSENPDAAISNGIFIQDGAVKWRDFEIKSA